MSLSYAIDVKLNLIYNEENIKYLLNKAISLNFTFHKHMLIDNKTSLSALNFEEAFKIVLFGFEDGGLKGIDILLNQEDWTYFILHILEVDGLILVMFSILSEAWSKKFINGEENIDIARYTKLLLQLTEDFEIESMEIDKN